MPITVRSNNRVEWRHTSQNKIKKVLLAGVAGCVWMSVWGGVTCVVRVLIYCKRWKPGMQKDGESSQQTDRQADRLVWWSVSSPWTSPWCEIDVSWNKMLFFLLWIGGWLSVSPQSGGLRGTSLLWQAFTVRAERGRCPANSSGNLLKSFEGKWTVL